MKEQTAFYLSGEDIRLKSTVAIRGAARQATHAGMLSDEPAASFPRTTGIQTIRGQVPHLAGPGRVHIHVAGKDVGLHPSSAE